MRSRLLTMLAGATALAIATAGGAHASNAAPCPAAFRLLSVASFEAVGPYMLPRYYDTAGNRNGYVCALALPDAARDADCRVGGVIACELGQLGLPLYHFKDDGSP